jgi:hypothetical protein
LKKMVSGLLLSSVVGFVCIFPACKLSDSIWRDIPDYPHATQVSMRTWVVLPTEGVDWSGVEWKYISSGDPWETVDSFYVTELSKKGWQDMAGNEPDNVMRMVGGYYKQISLYEDITILENYHTFSRNDGKDWVILWVGIKETNPVLGKTYTMLNDKSYNTFFMILRSKS